MSIQREIELLSQFTDRAMEQGKKEGYDKAIQVIGELIFKWREFAEQWDNNPFSYSPETVGQAYRDCANQLRDKIYELTKGRN